MTVNYNLLYDQYYPGVVYRSELSGQRLNEPRGQRPKKAKIHVCNIMDQFSVHYIEINQLFN